jgi:hypothetical protein
MTTDTLHPSSINAFSPLVSVPASLLQDLQEALQALQGEVATLQATVARQGEIIAASERWQGTLSDNQFTQLKLINGLREDLHKEPEPSQGELERVARIEKLCQDAPGHIISLPELRGRLGIEKAVLSRLLKRINQDKFYLRQSKTDKRIRYLCLRPEVR